MKDKKYFLDTNIILYNYSKDEPKKKEVSQFLLIYNPQISIQVLSEISNVLLRKFKIAHDEVKNTINEIKNTISLCESIDIEIVIKAIEISKKFQYSFYDSQIIASALVTNCDILFSEDLNDGHIINNKLKIIDPYKLNKNELLLEIGQDNNSQY